MSLFEEHVFLYKKLAASYCAASLSMMLGLLFHNSNLLAYSSNKVVVRMIYHLNVLTTGSTYSILCSFKFSDYSLEVVYFIF